MPTRPGVTPPPTAPGDSDQSRLYVLVILTEVIVIAALYWLGRAFS